jgi:hypothetical protein
MSQVNQLKAVLAIGSVLAVLLMWNVEREAVRGRPAHPHSVQTHGPQSGQPTAQSPSTQPARI